MDQSVCAISSSVCVDAPSIHCEMGALSIKLARKSSSEDVSCDLDTFDQGTLSNSSSSSPAGTPFSGPSSNISGILESSQSSSCQGSSVTSRASSIPDAVVLQNTAAAADQTDAQQPQQQQRQEDSAQICFDFTKGMCTRGDKCKYSHDIATIVHFNSKEKGICFDYLRNQCHRGLLCRFSHDLSNIAQQCQVYNGPAAAAASKSRSGSICYDFVKGVCTRGSECRYSHDLTLIARMARGSNGVEIDQGPQADVCFDYLRGRCSRGDTCKYSHNPGMLHNPAALNPLGLDPGFIPGWPLPGLNTQAAAAAAAAAAAIAATGGVTPAATAAGGLNPFAAAAAAGMGGLNPFARAGMMGLGADPLAAAAAAVSLAASPAGSGGLVGGAGSGVNPFTGGFNGLMNPAAHLTRPGSLDSSACGTPTQMMSDAFHTAAAAGNDPLTLLMAMQQQQQRLAAAAVAASAAAAGPVPAVPMGVAGAAVEPVQMMMANMPDVKRLMTNSPQTIPNPGMQCHTHHKLSGGHLPSMTSAAAGLPSTAALLPPLNKSRFAADLASSPATASGFNSPASMTGQVKAAGGFGSMQYSSYEGVSSGFGPGVTAGGSGGQVRAGSAGPSRFAQQAHVHQGAGFLGRANSAPVASQLPGVKPPGVSAAASGPSGPGAVHSQLAAHLNRLSLHGGSKETLSDAQEALAAPRASSTEAGYPGSMSGGVAGLVGSCDGVAAGSPSSAGADDWESSPEAVIGSGDELEGAPYGDLLPRIQAIWSR